MDNEPNSSYVNQFLNQGCRSTNFAEGLNHKLRDIFHSPHPELGHFLDVMRQELESHTIQAERIINGQLPKLRKKAYRQAERRYINAKIILEDHFANNDINFEYLILYSRHQQRNTGRSLKIQDFELLNDDEDDFLNYDEDHIFDEINENEIENNENNDPNLNEEDSEFLNEFIDIEK